MTDAEFQSHLIKTINRPNWTALGALVIILVCVVGFIVIAFRDMPSVEWNSIANDNAGLSSQAIGGNNATSTN